MFFESGIECMFCFADVEFAALSTTNHIYVIRLAVEVCVSCICSQWWLAKYFGHLCTCLWKTPVFQNDVLYMECRGVVQET